MNALKLGLLLCFSATTAQADIDFYVNAHGDDTALFMGRSLSQNIQAAHDAGHRVILITTTAGDAGAGSTDGVGTAPTYLAREQGFSHVLQFLWGRYGATQNKIQSQMTKIAGKSIYRAQLGSDQHQGKIAWYNLRLPDGNLQGQGYPSTQTQSLLRLEQGEIHQIAAIDQSANYSKHELIQVFQAILRKEAKGEKKVRVHLPDQNSTAMNPDDHTDHQATSRFFSTALKARPFQCVSQVFYSTYVNANKAINMHTDDLWLHIGMWGALNQGLSAAGQPTTWNPEHNAWLGREYRPLQIDAQGECHF